VSDIDAALMDSLKVLDPKPPIREADSSRTSRHVRKVPTADIAAKRKSRPKAASQFKLDDRGSGGSRGSPN
jgi:hypothetical protein